jgi:hypothetical protein
MKLIEMEKQLGDFLNKKVEDIKRELIDNAVVVKRFKGESVYVSIFKQGKYDIRVSTRDMYDDYKDNERFLFKFFPIEPRDLDKYETVELNKNGKLVDDEGNEYNTVKVINDMKKLILKRGYTCFNYQWKMFVRAFNDWMKENVAYSFKRSE